MEHLTPEELGLELKDHEFMVTINGMAKALNTRDTAMWIYPKPYSMLNHIIRWDGENQGERWYGVDQETIDYLHEQGITMITPPHPTIEILGEWWTVEMADFDSEMAYYEKTGQLPIE